MHKHVPFSEQHRSVWTIEQPRSPSSSAAVSMAVFSGSVHVGGNLSSSRQFSHNLLRFLAFYAKICMIMHDRATIPRSPRLSQQPETETSLGVPCLFHVQYTECAACTARIRPYPVFRISHIEDWQQNLPKLAAFRYHHIALCCPAPRAVVEYGSGLCRTEAFVLSAAAGARAT